MDACSVPWWWTPALVRVSGWVPWGRTLISPHSTVSADTEVVGRDGQHNPHLGPASRLLLPASHLYQPHRLQVSALALGSVPHSCSFLSALFLGHLVCLFPENGMISFLWRECSGRWGVLPLRYLSMRFLYFLGHGSGGGQHSYLSALFVVN